MEKIFWMMPSMKDGHSLLGSRFESSGEWAVATVKLPPNNASTQGWEPLSAIGKSPLKTLNMCGAAEC